MSPGGGSGSLTVMVNEQVSLLPELSEASKEILVTPNGNTEPLGSPSIRTFVTAVQLSVEDGGL